MKKIILFIFVIILIGCNNIIKCIQAPKGGNTETYRILMKGGNNLSYGLRTLIVDSCEYIAGFNRLAHKGNCEFCKERRKQEIKELIKQVNYDYKGNSNN